MEIFQNVWAALTMPNVQLTNILGSFMLIIEMFVTMLLFTTILDIKSTKKQKTAFVLGITILFSPLSIFFPDLPYLQFAKLIVIFLFIMICFKTKPFKTLLAQIIPLIVFSLLEPLFVIIFTCIFNIKIQDITTNPIPIYKISIAALIYLSTFIIALLAKQLKFNSSFLEHIDSRNKGILLLNTVFGLIAIISQIYLFTFYSQNMPYMITAISIVGLVAYFFISLYSLTKTVQLQRTQEDLEESQLYNKSLKILHDNNRAFKHDFSNIVQSIGRLCSNWRYERITNLLFSTFR